MHHHLSWEGNSLSTGGMGSDVPISSAYLSNAAGVSCGSQTACIVYLGPQTPEVTVISDASNLGSGVSILIGGSGTWGMECKHLVPPDLHQRAYSSCVLPSAGSSSIIGCSSCQCPRIWSVWQTLGTFRFWCCLFQGYRMSGQMLSQIQVVSGVCSHAGGVHLAGGACTAFTK